tara:strand:+ start:248 stop:559 length:312 start_codon:yes stop_codon:yes gene_type:complete
MIDINEKGIGYTDFAKISQKQSEFIKYLIKTKIDFIIDCTKVAPRKEFIEKIFDHQKNVKKCLVIVILNDVNLKFNNEWNIIPTKIEAFDFISFEQIQREIGY